jgi:hypothetical protein
MKLPSTGTPPVAVRTVICVPVGKKPAVPRVTRICSAVPPNSRVATMLNGVKLSPAKQYKPVVGCVTFEDAMFLENGGAATVPSGLTSAYATTAPPAGPCGPCAP